MFKGLFGKKKQPQSLNAAENESRKAEQPARKMTDQDKFLETALNKKLEKKVRIDAFNKLDDTHMVEFYIQETGFIVYDLKTSAEELVERVDVEQDTFYRLAMSGDRDYNQLAVTKLTDQKLLAQVALNHKKEFIRKCAVGLLEDPETISQIALNDESVFVREAAIQKIDDQALLEQIAMNDRDDSVCCEAAERLTDPDALYRVAFKKNNDNHQFIISLRDDCYTASKAVEKIDNQAILADIALNAPSQNACLKAVYKLSDQDALQKVAEHHPVEEVREQAVRRITDQSFLVHIAETDDYYGVQKKAMERIDDQSVLSRVIKDEDIKHGVRCTAASRSTDIPLLKEFIEYDYKFIPYANNGASILIREAAAKRLCEIGSDEDKAFASQKLEEIESWKRSSDDWSDSYNQ